MALVSSKVAAGMEILADQFNKLWTDLTQNHNHATGSGGIIDHSNLTDSVGAMAGFTNDHGDIDDHIAAEQGVHGMPAAGYAIGGIVGDMFVIAGQYTPSGGSGTIYFSTDGTITGKVNLSTVLSINVTTYGTTGGEYQHAAILEVTSYDAASGSFDYRWDVPNGGATPTKIFFTVIGTI